MSSGATVGTRTRHSFAPAGGWRRGSPAWVPAARGVATPRASQNLPMALTVAITPTVSTCSASLTPLESLVRISQLLQVVIEPPESLDVGRVPWGASYLAAKHCPGALLNCFRHAKSCCTSQLPSSRPRAARSRVRGCESFSCPSRSNSASASARRCGSCRKWRTGCGSWRICSELFWKMTPHRSSSGRGSAGEPQCPPEPASQAASTAGPVGWYWMSTCGLI